MPKIHDVVLHLQDLIFFKQVPQYQKKECVFHSHTKKSTRICSVTDCGPINFWPIFRRDLAAYNSWIRLYRKFEERKVKNSKEEKEHNYAWKKVTPPIKCQKMNTYVSSEKKDGWSKHNRNLYSKSMQYEITTY